MIDFPCSYPWGAYYAETMEGVYLPDIEPPPYTLEEFEERLTKLEVDFDARNRRDKER